ncbi:MAG: hypothetical protein ACLQU2_06420 [Candidatus Binataceae bacterium]
MAMDGHTIMIGMTPVGAIGAAGTMAVGIARVRLDRITLAVSLAALTWRTPADFTGEGLAGSTVVDSTAAADFMVAVIADSGMTRPGNRGNP